MFNDGGRMRDIIYGNPTCPHCGVTYPITERHECVHGQTAKIQSLERQVESLTKAVEVHRTTLRDQFAIAALPGTMRAHGVFKDMAEDAYAIADAMMEARKQSAE